MAFFIQPPVTLSLAFCAFSGRDCRLPSALICSRSDSGCHIPCPQISGLLLYSVPVPAQECPYGYIRTNRKTHYYQGCSGVVKRAYKTKYRNKNVYKTIYCCFLKTKKSMSNLNQRGFSDLSLFFFHYNTPFGGGRLGGDKEPFHIKDKRAATR